RDSYDELAILSRTNAQSRILDEALRKRNIPYRIYGGLSFYQRKEVKDAVAYFRLSVNPDDDEALKRIINFPARGIGETTLNKLTRTALDHRASVWEVICDLDKYNPGVNSGTAKKLNNFREIIETFIKANKEGLSAYDLAKLIIERVGLLAMFVSDNTPESISRRENIEELLAGVKEFVESRVEEGDEHISMTDFLSDVSLATDQDSKIEEGCITLMTVHAAKGLEFNNVFIVGVEDGFFPSLTNQDSPTQVEEERRLLYVAITRARKFCMMSYASSRLRYGETILCKPSPFLNDIDLKYLKPVGGADFDSSYRTSVNPVENYRSRYNPVTGGARSLNSLRTPRQQPTARPVTGGEKSGIHSPANLKPGMIIEHNRFGRGTIIEIDTTMADARIKVEFDNTGERILMLKFAHFEIIQS
ncbi:MAG: ATP-binding domain-containing protein, partial [Duncaniella sp.]|nr:ATP-binding domain-containing protein [Duncaniella sp.]